MLGFDPLAAAPLSATGEAGNYVNGVGSASGTSSSSIVPAVTDYVDPHHASVVSLLHCNGTDGSATFTEETGKTWTRAGNAQIDTAIKKYGSASGLFDGSGDYLSTPNVADLRFGTGDYTVEAWIYNTVRPGGGVNNDMTVFGTLSGTGYLFFYLDNATGKPVVWNGSTGIWSSTAVPLNTWTHVAWVRSSGTVKIYIDGVQTGSGTHNLDNNNTTETIKIGGNAGGFSNRYFYGQLDDIRITKGVARYLGNFVSPNAELPNPSDTALHALGIAASSGLADAGAVGSVRTSGDVFLQQIVSLLHMDGANDATVFNDATGKRWTRTGTAALKTATKKFGTASLYCDGNGDYLSSTDDGSFDFSTGDFTLEAWINLAGPSGTTETGTGNRNGCIIGNDTGTTGWNFFVYGDTTDTKSGLYLETKLSGVGAAASAAYAFNYGQWYHVAVTRKAGSVRFFVDGAQVGSTATISAAVTCGGSNIWIGAALPGSGWSRYFNGYIDDLRVTKGVARYDGSYSVPTEAFPENVGASALLHFNGANASTTFIDQSGRSWTVAGNAQLGTDAYKFATAALKLDGSGDYTHTPHTLDLDLGTHDFTIELFFKQGAVPSSAFPNILSKRSSGTSEYSYIVWLNGTNNNVNFTYSTTGISDGSTAVGPYVQETSNWHHLAVVRKGSYITVYVDGVGGTPHYIGTTPIYSGKAALGIGVDGAGGTLNTSSYWNGRIDEVRFTKGYARYTTDFTPPASEFTDILTLEYVGAAGSAAGIAASAFVGSAEAAGTVESGAGASNGAASAEAVGSYILVGLGAGSSDGIATASATGGSTHGSTGSADGIAAALVVGGGITSAQASGSGVASDAITGGWIISGVAAAAGTAGADAEGKRVGYEADAAGSSTALAVGGSIEQAAGSSAGVAADSVLGNALHEVVGSADGTSALNATGGALADGAASADGVASASATSQRIRVGVANAAGDNTSSGGGSFLRGGTASASAAATVGGEGNSIDVAAGLSGGTGSVSATGQSQAQAVAASSGVASDNVIGRALSPALYLVGGTATAGGDGRGIIFAVGDAAGQASGSAQPETYATAIGTAEGTNQTAGATSVSFAQAIAVAAGVAGGYYTPANLERTSALHTISARKRHWRMKPEPREYVVSARNRNWRIKA